MEPESKAGGETSTEKSQAEAAIDARPDLAAKLAELEILRQSLVEAQDKEKDLFDQLLRLKAEFENFRKRSEVRIQDARKAGREDVLLEIIGLNDALHQAESSCRSATEVGPVLKGLDLVLKLFEKFLKDHGVRIIEAKGARLDPMRHEVLAQEERDDVDDGVVTEEIQKGYLFNDRVLRPARVRVSVKPKPPKTDS